MQLVAKQQVTVSRKETLDDRGPRWVDRSLDLDTCLPLVKQGHVSTGAVPVIPDPLLGLGWYPIPLQRKHLNCFIKN
jgi:hypothetical protein